MQAFQTNKLIYQKKVVYFTAISFGQMFAHLHCLESLYPANIPLFRKFYQKPLSTNGMTFFFNFVSIRLVIRTISYWLHTYNRFENENDAYELSHEK